MRYVCTVLGLAACALLMLWFGSVAAAQPREIEADPPKQQLTEAHRDIHDFGLAKRVIDFVLGPPECGVMIMSGKRPSRFGKFIYGKAGLAISFGEWGIPDVQLIAE